MSLPSKKPISVVQLVPRLNEGGVERGTLDIVREHTKTATATHVVIGEGGKLAGQIIRHGGRFMPLPLASKNPLTALSRIQKLRHTLSIISPDIVHVRSRVPAWLHYFANGTLHFPTVSTAHGINSVNPYSRIMCQADTVICPGSAVEAHLKKAYKIENTIVIPRGVDIEYFNPDKVSASHVAKLREQWQLNGRRVILHVGRLAKQKGHEILLRAMAKLPSDNIALIVGDGKDKRRGRLAALARKLGVEDKVRFAGSCDNMCEIYSLADIVLSCAIKPETFGRSIAEALAMNKPVIATNHGGARDIIGDDETGGVLIPPADIDALVTALLAPPPDATSSRQRITEKFTAAKMAAQTLEVYRNVLAARKNQALI